MKNIFRTAFVGLAALAAAACNEDFLEVEHYSIVSPEGVYTNEENIFKGLVGVYNTLYASGKYYPHPVIANVPALDLQADGWDSEMVTHSWQVEAKSGFFINAWECTYNIISRANQYLSDLANVGEDVMGAVEKNIYVGETRGIRGWAYYYLTINFDRVPMLLDGETYANTPDKARPETNDEAWAAILEDLDYAASALDWTPADGMTGRFTKGAALGLAGKVCMYMEDYDKAKAYFRQVIDDDTHSLNPVYAMTSWLDYAGNVEALFEIAFPKFPKMGWDIGSYASNNDCRFVPMQTKAREYGGWGDSFTSYEFVRSFEPGDKRKKYSLVCWDANEDQNPDKDGIQGDTNPFTGDEIGGSGDANFAAWFINSAEGCPNNHCIKWWKTNDVYAAFTVNLYRYADLLLDYAECCFRSGDEAAGWKAVAEIRDRAWGNLEVGLNPNDGRSYLEMPLSMLNDAVVEVPDAKEHYTEYAEERGYTSPVWLVAVMQERRKELYYEFSFWYDLCRCGLVEEWLDCEYPKNGGASFYNTATGRYYVPSGTDKNEPWDNASAEERANMIPVTGREWDWNPIHLVYPIPTSELTANHLMVQNEGY